MKKLILSILIMVVLVGCGENEYEVTYVLNNGGDYYKEVVTQGTFNGEIAGYGTNTYIVSKGVIKFTWVYSNVNGFGQHLNPTTKTDTIDIQEDTKIIIRGSKVSYKGANF